MSESQIVSAESRQFPRISSDFAAILILAAVTSVTLCRVLWASFLSYDDPFYVTNNSLVQAGFSATSLTRAWTTFECANWHPGTWMSLMLDHQIYGLQSWGFHLTNLLLHVANTSLLYLLLRRLKLEWGPAVFVAAVFGIHPLHVESVAWVTERKDVLATLFGLLSILAYERSVESGDWRPRLLSCGLFFLSLISKPLLVTLPCLLLVLDYWRLSGQPASTSPAQTVPTSPLSIRRFLALTLEKWQYWLLTAGSATITVMAQHEGGAVATLRRFNLAERLVNACIAYCSYLQKSFWPTRLAVYYPYALNRWSLAGALMGVAFLGIVTFWAWRMRKRRPEILVGWLWYLGTLVPMIGLVQVGTQSMADRYMYFPLIGLTWSVTAAVQYGWAKARLRPQVLGLIATSLVLISSILTWHQSGVWKNDLLLSQHALQVTTDNYIAHEMHARALRVAGLNEHAIAEYRRAIAINPEYFSARNDLGLLLMQRNDFSGAVEQFRLGLKTVPHHSRIRWNLATALTRQRDFTAADHEFRIAESRAPRNDALVLDHARSLQQAGQFPAALEMYERAVSLAPGSLVNQLELAVALSRAPQDQGRDLPRAISLLQKLCRQTDAPRAWTTLGEVESAAGHTAAADIAWNRAIERAQHLKRPDLVEIARASRVRHTTSKPAAPSSLDAAPAKTVNRG